MSVPPGLMVEKESIADYRPFSGTASEISTGLRKLKPHACAQLLQVPLRIPLLLSLIKRKIQICKSPYRVDGPRRVPGRKRIGAVLR